ncbi:MAG: hypothetical protein IAF38_16980, partial [Bacteroidia bacterium]|nr:hypothetical protein [Bacteroidia bacterium]
TYELVENNIELAPANKMETGSFKLRFKCGEKRYLLTDRKMLKTVNGWKLTKAIYLEIKDAKKEDEAVNIEAATIDSVMKAQISEMQFQMDLQTKMKQIADSTRMSDSLRKAQELQFHQKKRKGK